jgi:hypothetical protein
MSATLERQLEFHSPECASELVEYAECDCGEGK